MIDRLMTAAAILAFVCATATLTPAFAQDEGEGVAPEPGTELIDPFNEDGGEVVIDDGEIAVEDGEVVPYGPEDCIECSGGPVTALDDGGRPVGENFRGDLTSGTEAVARSGGESRDVCDATRIGKTTGVCR